MFNIPLVKNMRVEQLLERKAHKGIESLPLNGTTVRMAAQFMRVKKISSVVFMKGEKPAGILTERDISNTLANYENPGQMPVSEVMTPWNKVKTIHIRSTVGDAQKEMIENGHRHGFAVGDGGNLEGVFSQRDINDAHYRNEELIETQRQ
ncbi:CBS domain-containing protein [Candidatus Woesebacteria bacterium]|nr:CBS domain-containing protein [Candidatus Woesebacteria bacterium]